MSKKTDLTTLIPDQNFVTSIGEITLRPFEFYMTNQAVDIISKYQAILFSPKEMVFENGQGVQETVYSVKSTADVVGEILKKQNDGNYSVIEDITILLLLSGLKDKESIGKLKYSEVVYLLSIIVKLNQDFFGQIQSLFTPPKIEEKTQTPIGETGLAA